MLDVLLGNPAFVWLAFGAFLMAFEAMTAPGLGLFLAGLGAICAGILTEFGIIDKASTPAQFAWFFGLTALWTALLWKPLKQFRTSRRNGGGAMPANNVVGEIAKIGPDGLKRGQSGQAYWSGTLMTAELDAGAAVDALPPGASVRIVSVTGTTLKVTPQ